jgi:hypothetical protein
MEKLNNNTVTLLSSLTVIFASGFGALFWLNDQIATKDDIIEVKQTISDLRIDSSINFIKLTLQNYDAKQNLTPDDVREKEMLEQTLLEYQLRKVKQ